jgi:RNA polymerase sigma factor (sigma-70 family)
MTTDQRELAEQNHNLIYHVLNRYGWPIDEYYDVAAIALCEAAIRYDPDYGVKFSTYACQTIKGKLLQELRKQRPVISLDEPITEDESITIGDTIPYHQDMKEGYLDFLARFTKLTKPQADIIKLKAAGYSQADIARFFGVSEQYVSYIVKTIRRRLRW